MKNQLLFFITAVSIYSSPLLFAQSDLRVKSPDPEIIQKLEEIVRIYELRVDTEQLKWEMGTGEHLIEAKIELTEAIIELEREKRRPDAVIAEMKRLVSLCQKRLNREMALYEREQHLSEDELAEMKLDLLRAEVQLLRAEKDSLPIP